MKESKTTIRDYQARVSSTVALLLEKYGEGFQNIGPEEEWVIGIDEAGRGPVLRPLVYGAAIFPQSVEKFFKAGSPNTEERYMKFDDSKKLTETVRHILFHDAIKKIEHRVCGYFVDVITPERMCNEAFSSISPQNLND